MRDPQDEGSAGGGCREPGSSAGGVWTVLHPIKHGETKMSIYTNNTFYEKISFNIESDFEKVVTDLSDQIFGPNTIYLNIKKKIKGNNIGVIPDGYLIDITIPDDAKLYIIENEIVSHDPFKHIGIQMLKFVTSFDDDQVKVRNLIMTEISSNPVSLKRLELGCSESGSRNIDNR